MSTNIINQDQQHSTKTLLLGLWGHLSLRRRTQLFSLLLVMLASGAAEMISLGAVLPFLVVLSEPTKLWQLPQTKPLIDFLGYKNPDQLLLPFTLVFALAVILAAAIRLTNLWLNGRIAAAVGSDLSCEAYRRTLYQPYGVHLQRNSAYFITGITTHIGLTVAVLNALLQLITSVIVAAGLLTGLLLINSKVALIAAFLFGTSYTILAISARRELYNNGQKISFFSGQQLKALQEGLGGIRDVLLDGSQLVYLDIYSKADRPQRLLQARNTFIGAFPRYTLEALGLVGIALLGLLLVLQKGSGFGVIPMLGALALGAQRLLPALQQIYSGWASLKGGNAAMADVLLMLNQPEVALAKIAEPLKINQTIRLENVSFGYASEKNLVLKGINLEIQKGERVGLIGTTGSGKSTTVDLLMGLLQPTVGRLLVDEVDLNDTNYPERLSAWRAAIAHVPQNIYLADSSIAENIAFGVPYNEIDLNLVKEAAKKAQISNFIEDSSDGYNSFVGERGIRLSGGQRQRIGIARALYKKTRVLVLDEATSALDTSTEIAVMDSVSSLSQELTIIMIAHRLSTVKRCDRVIRLAEGTITADGSPSHVLSGTI